MILSDAKANLDTISSIMIVSDSSSRVLFYFGSSKLFVNTSFALHADWELSPLKHKLIVVTLLGEQIICTSVFKSCKILVERVILKANLIPLKMWDFDVILGKPGNSCICVMFFSCRVVYFFSCQFVFWCFFKN